MKGVVMGCKSMAYFIMLPVVLLSIVILSGCGKRVVTTQTTGAMKPEIEVGQAVSSESITEPPIPQVEGLQEGALTAEQDKETLQPHDMVKRISDVYFDFDRYLIRDDARGTLYDNSGMLKRKEFKSLVIEGHADERGTTDYNLALGERRAESTRRYLTTLGISPSKISIISFGKEKPFCTDHNEDCWQQNRRAHFVMNE